MKIAFVGKGGSGKTTLAAITAQHLVGQKFPVLVVDADINQHMGYSLGLSEEDSMAVPEMGIEMDTIKRYLRGTNSRISAVKEMTKTTPPGTGSRLLTVTEENPMYDHFAKDIDGIRFMRVGALSEDDVGVKCYHSKTGSIELLLNHLIDGEKEYVIADMTAGTDSFASGLFTRFDVTFLIVEPTMKSVAVYKQYKKYADRYGTCIRVIGNRVRDESDISFIKKRVGNDFVVAFSDSDFVRSTEKGGVRPIGELEPENRQAIQQIAVEVDRQEKDWEKFYQQAVEFHKKNAESWANAAVGTDVTDQIDPSFSLAGAVVHMQTAHTT